jgi:hypothetical protein
MKHQFLTMQEAARSSGASLPTVKKWVSRVLKTDPNAPIRKEDRPQGTYRYLIDADFFNSHFSYRRRRTSSIDKSQTNELVQILKDENKLLNEQLALANKRILQLIELLNASDRPKQD